MSNRTNGAVVREFEEAFAQYVGAKYAIACSNGTASLHTALVALGVQPGDRVAVPPLTMASTTLAVLHAGAVPEFWDVDPTMWTMPFGPRDGYVHLPVSLYGAWSGWDRKRTIDDAAQTLNPHRRASFTSYSFQASKLLSAGEGGMLVTDDGMLAGHAREFANLGYPHVAGSRDLKWPDVVRHVMIGYNYRMADCQAALLLPQIERADKVLAARRYSADCYRQAIQGCEWIQAQHVPEGWPHSWWTFAIACDTRERADAVQAAIVQQGGELCYRAWRLTYNEAAFAHLTPWRRVPSDREGEFLEVGETTCPVAEDLQPRLLQLQTNHDKAGSERAAEILHRALADCEAHVVS